jgi:hypothetical protein
MRHRWLRHRGTETQRKKLDADCAAELRSIRMRNLNHRWLKTNAALGCARPVLRLPIIKLLPSVICVHLSNLRPKLVQYLRVSVPLWQSQSIRMILSRQPIPDGRPSDLQPNSTDV